MPYYYLWLYFHITLGLMDLFCVSRVFLNRMQDSHAGPIITAYFSVEKRCRQASECLLNNVTGIDTGSKLRSAISACKGVRYTLFVQS